MGTYTGTSGYDVITPDDLSPGVDASPSGTRPSNANDILYGLAGDDMLWGGGGRDRLYGGAGMDDLYSTGNHSALYGGAGNDSLTSSGTQSSLYGGAGRDNLVCSFGGSQTLLGQAGADILEASGGDHKLKGGAAKDYLNGERGLDQLTGGTGNDVFEFDSLNSAGDRITDFHDTKGDNDRFHISSWVVPDVKKSGQLEPDRFQVSDRHEAQTADVRFIFDTSDITLWFDANGSEAGGLTLIADLQAGAEITHHDIWLM